MLRLAGFLGAILAASFCLGAAPDIDSCAPLAIRPGTATDVVISGNDLPAAPSLWTSFPATVEVLGGPSSTKVRFRITTSPQAAVGLGAVRIFGSNGVSNLEFIMLDDLPGIAEIETNRTQSAAQLIMLGSAVDGAGQELGYDWFKFHATKGQRASIEVVAARLGSKLDSVLRVLDASGRLLAQNDDAPGLRGDSFITLAAPSSGDYFIELRDVNYGGGSQFFYRLRLGDFSLATTAFPPVVQPGRKRTIQLAGPNGEVGRAPVFVATNSTVTAVAFQGRNGSTFAKVLSADGPEAVEREPNDKPASATKISLADGISGRFDKPGDRDGYEFIAHKGERMEFRAATRSLGSPCDVVMELQSANGVQLTRSDPSAPDEGVVTYKFVTNGTYRLIVEEATGASGPNCVYHVSVDRAAGFALALENDRISVAPGKSFDLKVTCGRGDYKGPVNLELEGLTEAFATTNNVIANGKTNLTMKVTAPETMSSGTLHHFSIRGTAKRNGAEVRVRASTAPAWRRQFPQMLYPPLEFDGVVALGVTAPK